MFPTMPITLAFFDAALPRLKPKLDALGLDVDLWTYDQAGMFHHGGHTYAPADIALDYCYVSGDVQVAGATDAVFAALVACRSIKVVQTFNAGLDQPYYAALARKGTRICNSASQGIAIAEYTFGQVMAVLQPIELQRAQQKAKVWKQTRFREISTTHWLIMGAGPIGSAIAKRAKAFDANVSVIRRNTALMQHVDRVGTHTDMHTFLADADVVVLACPLNAKTRGMVDAAFFAAVNHGAILVNIARGALIDDAEMIAALDRGQVATAILDVFTTEPLPTDNPLWSHPGVRLTPHTSFFGNGGPARLEQQFLDTITAYAAGRPLPREVAAADVLG
jgi:phosphoglycerate dehydrogenase-like enzyme